MPNFSHRSNSKPISLFSMSSREVSDELSRLTQTPTKHSAQRITSPTPRSYQASLSTSRKWKYLNNSNTKSGTNSYRTQILKQRGHLPTI